jgi:pimeloyl-ACP methyl ester carboxylesterase
MIGTESLSIDQEIASEEMDRVEVDGLRIAFSRSGEGPALVLVHGALSDSRVWQRQVEDLSEEFTVVAWDAPGCGQSADPPESFRMPEYADCLAGLVETLRLEKPHLLGHSFGGALALEVYRRHPTLPATLILAGGYAGWAGSLPADEVSRRLLFAERAADLLATGGFQPRSMPGLFSAAMPVDTARALEVIMADSRPVATRAMARALAECNLNDMLSDITVPTLLLYGDADERSGPEVAKGLNAHIPTSTLSILPGMGHMGYLESPEQFDNTIRDFLNPLL